jgi:hypothetical protein
MVRRQVPSGLSPLDSYRQSLLGRTRRFYPLEPFGENIQEDGHPWCRTKALCNQIANFRGIPLVTRGSAGQSPRDSLKIEGTSHMYLVSCLHTSAVLAGSQAILSGFLSSRFQR